MQLNPDVNQQWRIAARPDGNVKQSDFQYHEDPIPTSGEGEFLLETLYLNLAPVMRMYMQGLPAAGERPLDIGDVIHGRGVGRVIQSHHPDYQVGDVIQGQIGWQTYKVSRATPQERMYKMPATIKEQGLSYSLGVSTLGMTGFSAYTGFMRYGEPQKGDVVVVSGAAGGVGSIVVQLAKIQGCRVIGIAGGADKCAFARSLGCDEMIDYKTDNIPDKLAEYCPDGLDIYFDNVGGDILQACLDRLAFGARVVLCGSISEYLRDEPFGPTNYTNLRAANASMRGFFVYNCADMFDQASHDMAGWIAEGKLKIRENILDGFDKMPDGLAQLYAGANQGVQLCRVRGDN